MIAVVLGSVTLNPPLGRRTIDRVFGHRPIFYDIGRKSLNRTLCSIGSWLGRTKLLQLQYSKREMGVALEDGHIMLRDCSQDDFMTRSASFLIGIEQRTD